MEVTRAKEDDINSIMEIIAEARTIMRENGNLTQWNDGYPSRQAIDDDIKNRHAHIILENGVIVGYFCFMVGDDPDPNYREIESGRWLNDKRYGVIHRLASGRKVKGIAKTAFDHAFSVIGNVRVDTHHDNVPMQRFLRNNGFTYCGIIHVADGSPRDAFQKDI